MFATITTNYHNKYINKLFQCYWFCMIFFLLLLLFPFASSAFYLRFFLFCCPFDVALCLLNSGFCGWQTMLRLSIESLLSCVLLSLNHHYYYFFFLWLRWYVCNGIQFQCVCLCVYRCISAEINWRFWKMNGEKSEQIMIKSENGQTAYFPIAIDAVGWPQYIYIYTIWNYRKSRRRIKRTMGNDQTKRRSDWRK